MDFFYKYILPISIIEIIAATVGTYYLINKKVKGVDKWIVYYLWLVLLVESYGFMVGFSKHTNYEQFGFLKDSFFENGRWAYNIFKFLSTVLFIFYFLNFIKNKKEKIVIKSLTLVYIILSLFLLSNTVNLQLPNIPLLVITGSLLLFITILLFFLNLLKSDKIIDLRTHFPFYVAMGYLFFLLSTTPLDIYYKYYDITLNESYVNLRATIYLYINMFLYSTLTLGFILCFRKKKSY